MTATPPASPASSDSSDSSATPASPLRRLTVFCGSNPGTDPAYAHAAQSLGTLLAERSIGVVYGGGRVGLMGVVADAVLATGGEVTGVIPGDLWDKEIGHSGLTELVVVGGMHERKLAMADRSDGFIALPGGVGTFEELLEVLTWTQLGIHHKPVGVLDVAGFYRPLVALLDTAVTAGFLRPDHREILQTADDPAELVDRLTAWRPADVPKWLQEDER